MLASKLKMIALFVGLTAILICAWTKPLDTMAQQRVDEGFKRAIVSFGTARLIGAVISVVQDIDFSAQPFGVGVKIAPGQVLHPIGDLVDKFADMMFAATVVFGAMKMLLIIGGSVWSSSAVTGTTLGWIWCHWRGRQSPIWLSKLVVVLFLVRFAVPIAMVGSDTVYKIFMADDYKASQSALAAPVDKLESSDKSSLEVLNTGGIGGYNRLKELVWSNINLAKSMVQGATQIAEHIIKVIVVFLLQTLVIPLLFFWALYRVFTTMFQSSLARRINKVDGEAVLDTRL
jgi:hypothetical protein